MTLLVKPEFHDFFIRSMVPMKHYWPIRQNSKCGDLKFAVEWGNNNTDKVNNTPYVYYISVTLTILTEIKKIVE